MFVSYKLVNNGNKMLQELAIIKDPRNTTYNTTKCIIIYLYMLGLHNHG